VLPLRFPFSDYCVKYSVSGSLNEAVALRFVASRTSVPVPKVYCAFQHRGVKYILMERIKGSMIREGKNNGAPIFSLFWHNPENLKRYFKEHLTTQKPSKCFTIPRSFFYYETFQVKKS